MGYTLEQILGRGLRKRLVRLVRDNAGMVPGEDLVDLHSIDGFLGLGLARRAPKWQIFSNHGMPETERDAPDNWEHTPLDLPGLPFEEDSMAAVVGAFLDGAFQPWSQDLIDEICRVLVPEGRILFLVRRPSPQASELDHGLPTDAVDRLLDAGLKRGSESRQMHLMDGSELHLLEATAP